jgi:predicted permease
VGLIGRLSLNKVLRASEYDAEPELVSSIVLLTTIVSVVTVTGWVVYLQGL